MERAISADERIKRAEEIYQRRRAQNYERNQARVNVGNTPKDYKLFKKMFIQIGVCLLIYLIFYIIKNSNYIFSDGFLKQAKEVLSYDINITETYNGITNWFASLGNQAGKEETMPSAEEQEEIKEENQVIQEETQTADTQTLSIAEDSSSISQTATDAEIIKANYSIIKPLTRNNNITFWST